MNEKIRKYIKYAVDEGKKTTKRTRSQAEEDGVQMPFKKPKTEPLKGSAVFQVVMPELTRL